MATDALRPRHIVRGFCDLDFEALARAGIHHLIIDVDNTIARFGSNALESGIPGRLASWRASGHLRAACIVSNVMFGRRAFQRVAAFGAELCIPHVCTGFVRRKPGPWGFEQAMSIMRSEPATTAVIGDQLYTDILGGNRLGLYTILVEPLGPDHWTTALTMRRLREREYLRRAGLSFESATGAAPR